MKNNLPSRYELLSFINQQLDRHVYEYNKRRLDPLIDDEVIQLTSNLRTYIIDRFSIDQDVVLVDSFIPKSLYCYIPKLAPDDFTSFYGFGVAQRNPVSSDHNYIKIDLDKALRDVIQHSHRVNLYFSIHRPVDNRELFNFYEIEIFSIVRSLLLELSSSTALNRGEFISKFNDEAAELHVNLSSSIIDQVYYFTSLSLRLSELRAVDLNGNIDPLSLSLDGIEILLKIDEISQRQSFQPYIDELLQIL